MNPLLRSLIYCFHLHLLYCHSFIPILQMRTASFLYWGLQLISWFHKVPHKFCFMNSLSPEHSQMPCALRLCSYTSPLYSLAKLWWKLHQPKKRNSSITFTMIVLVMKKYNLAMFYRQILKKTARKRKKSDWVHGWIDICKVVFATEEPHQREMLSWAHIFQISYK